MQFVRCAEQKPPRRHITTPHGVNVTSMMRDELLESAASVTDTNCMGLTG